MLVYETKVLKFLRIVRHLYWFVKLLHGLGLTHLAQELLFVLAVLGLLDLLPLELGLQMLPTLVGHGAGLDYLARVVDVEDVFVLKPKSVLVGHCELGVEVGRDLGALTLSSGRPLGLVVTCGN